MTSDCVDLEDLSALLDGELETHQIQTVTEHVRNCPSCESRLGELKRLGTAMRSFRDELVGPGLEPLPTKHSPVQQTPRGSLRTAYLAAAASVALTLGVVLGELLVHPMHSPGPVSMAPFDPIPFGGICIGLDACYTEGGQ